jgi:hypothetical protein
MRRNTLGIAAATLAAAGALGIAGAAIASAADDTTATPTPSASASPDAGRAGGAGGPGGASQDTAVTGDEADKVIAAVTAKDSSVTIDTVRKDPDGSYDALGTKDGSPVFFDVSADLKTVTENAGGPGGRMGPPGDTTTSSDPSAATTGSAV